jgi:hypothetical protein
MDYYFYYHFVVEETETQRNLISMLKMQEVVDLRFKPKKSG